MSHHDLYYDKETDNNYRWIAHLDDAPFELYIPKTVAPHPPPQWIRVWVEADSAQVETLSADLTAVVTRVDELTKTVRYKPVGDPETWQIGEPYIPMSILPEPWPDRLNIAVAWK